MESRLKRRIIGALIAALITSSVAVATVRVTVELSLLTFYLFSAMCALFLGMAMIHWYRETKDRTTLLLYGVTVPIFVGSMIAFEVARSDLIPDARDLRLIRVIVTAGAVAITWGMAAAWLLEAGMKKQWRLDRQEDVEETRT